MSLLDRLEVPAAQSRASSSPTESPRLAASSAAPAPVTPPPITRTSTTSSASRARSARRRSGDSAVPLMSEPSMSPTVPPRPVGSVALGVGRAPVHCEVHHQHDQYADDEPEERAGQRVDQPGDDRAEGSD